MIFEYMLDYYSFDYLIKNLPTKKNKTNKKKKHESVCFLNHVFQKILAGEKFGEFGDLLRIRQSFTSQLLEKASGWA